GCEERQSIFRNCGTLGPRIESPNRLVQLRGLGDPSLDTEAGGPVRPLRQRTVTLVVLVGAAAAFAVPAVSAAPAVRARPSCASATTSGGDWPSGRHDLAASGRQDAEGVLGPEAAKHLAPAWAFDVDPQNGTPDSPSRFDIASLQST